MFQGSPPGRGGSPPYKYSRDRPTRRLRCRGRCRSGTRSRPARRTDTAPPFRRWCRRSTPILVVVVVPLLVVPVLAFLPGGFATDVARALRHLGRAVGSLGGTFSFLALRRDEVGARDHPLGVFRGEHLRDLRLVLDRAAPGRTVLGSRRRHRRGAPPPAAALTVAAHTSAASAGCAATPATTSPAALAAASAQRGEAPLVELPPGAAALLIAFVSTSPFWYERGPSSSAKPTNQQAPQFA